MIKQKKPPKKEDVIDLVEVVPEPEKITDKKAVFTQISIQDMVRNMKRQCAYAKEIATEHPMASQLLVRLREVEFRLATIDDVLNYQNKAIEIQQKVS